MFRDYAFNKKSVKLQLKTEPIDNKTESNDASIFFLMSSSYDNNFTQQLQFKYDSECSLTCLHFPFQNGIVPRGIDIKNWKQAFTNARLFLLGITHDNVLSRQAVMELITRIQPDILMVELDQERAQHFIGKTNDELNHPLVLIEIDNQSKYMSFEDYYKDQSERFEKLNGQKVSDLSWIYRWLFNRTLRKAYKNQKFIQKKEAKRAEDCEFRSALMAAQKVKGCNSLVLGDLQQELTMNAIEQCKDRNALMKFRELQANCYNKLIYAKKGDMTKANKLTDAINKILNEEPRVKHIYNYLYERRNRHMVRVMHTMLHRCTIEKFCASERLSVDFEPVIAVGIVGEAHVFGITDLWNRPVEVYS